MTGHIGFLRLKAVIMATESTTTSQDLLEHTRRILTQTAEPEAPAASACCSSEKQEVCCEPSEKASCCGTDSGSGTGCGCQ